MSSRCYTGCWRNEGHHACAIVEVWRLATALADAVDLIEGECVTEENVEKLRPSLARWSEMIVKIENNKGED